MIIIIGAGISGLSVAYFLQQKGLDVTILERDDQFDSERQGFSLTIHSNTLNILNEYGLDDIYQNGHKIIKQIFYDHNGNILYNNPNDSKSMIIQRQMLRQMFYLKLHKDTVKFGIKVTDISIFKNGVYIYTNDKEYMSDYVIACDGLNSIIRNKFLEIKPLDLKLHNIYGISDLSKVSDETKSIFINSEVQVLDGYHRLFSKPFSNNKQMWEITWPNDNPIYNNKDPLDLCKDAIKDWSFVCIHELLNASENKDIIVHPLYDIDPKIIDFKKLPDRLIMIGDTVHPMAPYIGMGANEAIVDAYKLSKFFQINKCFNITPFYEELALRTSKSVLRSRENTQFYHSSDAIVKEKLWKFKKWK